MGLLDRVRTAARQTLDSTGSRLAAGVARAALATVERADGWVNRITGLGTAIGRNDYRFFRGRRLSLRELSDMFHGDPFAQRVCAALPRDAFRRGFAAKLGDKEAEARVAAELQRLGTTRALVRAWTWARRDGGALVYVAVNDGQDPREPLAWDRIERVRELVVLTRLEAQPIAWEGGDVARYLVTRIGPGGGQSVEIHASRMLRFDGSMTDRLRRLENGGWAESALQLVIDKLAQFEGALASTWHLVGDASQPILKLKNLWSMLTADTEDAFRRRVSLLDYGRSAARVLLLDSEEDFDRKEVGALSGLAPLIQLAIQITAGAAEMPATRFMGMSPAGMNATGESDTRTWYDRVEGGQVEDAEPRLRVLVRMVLRARLGPTAGREPASWSIVWAPLWKMTDAEQAELRFKVASTDQIYVTIGALTPQEIAASRFPPEGWSPDYVVDLEARRLVSGAEADVAAGATGDPAADLPTRDVADDDDAISNVLRQVAAREIPRTAGLARLARLGLTPEEAEAQMDEVGRSFFTAPEQTWSKDMEDLKQAHSKLQASWQGKDAYLKAVLEKNKRGELVVGSLVGVRAEVTEKAPGEPLAAGDVVAVPADAPPPEAPAARPARTDFVEKRGANWVVLSHTGAVLGEYTSEVAARERLRQIEAAKAAKGGGT